MDSLSGVLARVSLIGTIIIKRNKKTPHSYKNCEVFLFIVLAFVIAINYNNSLF